MGITSEWGKNTTLVVKVIWFQIFTVHVISRGGSLIFKSIIVVLVM